MLPWYLTLQLTSRFNFSMHAVWHTQNGLCGEIHDSSWLQGTYSFHRTLGWLLKWLWLGRKGLSVTGGSSGKRMLSHVHWGGSHGFPSLCLHCWQPFCLLRPVCTSSFLSGILTHSYTGNEGRGGNCLLGLLWSNPEAPEVRRPESPPKFIQDLHE